MIGNETHPSCAYVVFDGQTELRFLKVLKSGFRHCFIILEFDNFWCSIDPLSTYCEIQIFEKKHIQDLPLWLKYQGFDLIKAKINRHDFKIRPFDYWSCVNLIKRILGIYKWWIITPWQLKKYLDKNFKKGD
tara:strand:+ start:1086 stop:1481 length:396 start_codon:yes stop_codon:yes gene_type:complete